MWHIEVVSSMRGHRIMAITSAFQADDAGSIPAARSNPIQSNPIQSNPICDF
ncbi:hypothetical protein THOG05_50205 [Vibrio rotiferianus]|nr:hypothetical protein THOG05_50205 [Vibrio rotiferianus]